MLEEAEVDRIQVIIKKEKYVVEEIWETELVIEDLSYYPKQQFFSFGNRVNIGGE